MARRCLLLEMVVEDYLITEHPLPVPNVRYEQRWQRSGFFLLAADGCPADPKCPQKGRALCLQLSQVSTFA